FKKIVIQKCFYCGDIPRVPKRSIQPTKRYPPVNGIDRVNSNLGYTLENIVPCCKRCNWMKLNISLTDFLRHVGRIYEKNRAFIPSIDRRSRPKVEDKNS